ncbi:hypothetical protein RND71_018383 [Anisodus tanguticus]|uniref:Uncharacterized protein n=1 Tax=Anisodus tanguticus TaxID=243964 RepID=A0AAE1VC19_9SOLA|nr:hypothetical protein RND71_018383 [Anisodus tanguticus]
MDQALFWKCADEEAARDGDGTRDRVAAKAASINAISSSLIISNGKSDTEPGDDTRATSSTSSESMIFGVQSELQLLPEH